MSYILDALRKADAQRARDPQRGIHAQPAAAMPGGARSGRRREHLFWGPVAGLILVAAAWVWSGGDGDTPAPTVPAVPPRPADAVVAPSPAPPAAIEILPAAPPVVAPPVAVAPPIAVAAPAAAVPAVVTERTYSLAELPAEVQQALPKFAVSGGVYSENVSQRMLIVNGQVFNEGSEIAPGVVLEQIRARLALLKFRGLRIAQPF